MTTILSSPESYTLLTGATGSIGAYLLQDLLRARLPVAVLVRAGRGMTAGERVDRLLSRAEAKTGRRFLRPRVLEGELNQPGMGLSRDDLNWLRKHCGRVLHSAACLSFAAAANHPENEPYRTNVEGTRNLLSVCDDVGIEEFHYVSTAYTCGLQSGAVPERLHDGTQQFANDYEHSKCQTEQLLAQCPNLTSLTIYRPSIVVDPCADAGQQTDQAISKAFSTYQLLASRFGLPEPDAWLKNLGLSGTEQKNIVSADWVARTIVQILRQRQLHGDLYHLTSAHGTTVGTLEAGFREALISDAELAEKTMRAKTNSVPAGPDLINKLAAPYVATFLPYFRNDPQFDQTNLNRALMMCRQVPAPQIGVSQICALAVNQTKGFPKVQREVVPGFEQVASVGRLLSEITESHDEADRLNNPLAQATTGIVLTGPGGGVWTLRQSTQGPKLTTGSNRSATQHLYTTMNILDRLVSGAIGVDAALSAGNLTLEDDGGSECHGWTEQVLRQLRDLLNLEEGADSCADEVIHAR